MDDTTGLCMLIIHQAVLFQETDFIFIIYYSVPYGPKCYTYIRFTQLVGSKWPPIMRLCKELL